VAGSSIWAPADYWRAIDRELLEACKVHITTVNPEAQDPIDDALFDQRKGDACALNFDDNAFDLAHSNSVIEHLGSWDQMERFAAETRRIAPRYYVQTPYFWFPIEPHLSAPLVHWAPEPMRARWLIKRGHAFVASTRDVPSAMRAVQDARLLDKTMMRSLFPDARLEEERVAGLTKSLMAIADEAFAARADWRLAGCGAGRLRPARRRRQDRAAAAAEGHRAVPGRDLSDDR